jgi:hypothetical protein
LFYDIDLQKHLEESSTVKSNSLIISEWNLNNSENISVVGNYRYRPTEPVGKYSQIPNSFDPLDEGYFYTDATKADTTIDGGLDEEDNPVIFSNERVKERMLYSLEDCFSRFRPRSGINKLRFFSENYTHFSNSEMSRRPRYYLSTKDDNFKYWTSYRTESDTVETQENLELREYNLERGIANKTINGRYHIEDAAPFVVYKTPIPANRIVVKVQTHVGDINLGPFSDGLNTIEDPFYGSNNSKTPKKWRIQALSGQNWVDLISFDQNQTRPSGLPIVPADGHVELAFSSSTGWVVLDPESNPEDFLVSDFTNPEFEISQLDGSNSYSQFQFINGLRIVVDTMNNFGDTLDLIELSPRLCADISDKVSGFSVTKPASDLGNSSLPVGQLLSATGTMSLFDYDNGLNPLNKDSILFGHSLQNTKILIYEKILDVSGSDYLIPIKTMYVDGFPSFEDQRAINLTLRDQFIQFETQLAPEILVTSASLSYAVSLLLDSIGFSNYVFRRIPGEEEILIPYFFVGPDKTVADVLNELAVSTQTAMFFDEYNNFVLMSKNYMIPSKEDRNTDITFFGSKDFEVDGVVSNSPTSEKLGNIVSLASKNNTIFNDGKINYDVRYIQRSYGKLKQASLLDSDKTWIYKPALLWEAAGTETTKSINDEKATMSNYVLTAMPLNSDLSDQVPYVSNNEIRNNIIDFGESIYWVARYNGYLYANGEIIKYDAVEYNIPGFEKQILKQSADGQLEVDEDGNSIVESQLVGSVGNVWIRSVQEYQKYFANLSFNGKIYPTGRVRIYAEPEFETDNESGLIRMVPGPIKKHGRNQFNTLITYHSAGISSTSHWGNNDNVRSCKMESRYLFDQTLEKPETRLVGAAGRNDELAKKTTRNGIIRNFLSSTQISEEKSNTLTSAQAGTVQSSALVMNGPNFTASESPTDFISYVYKPMPDSFKHFGTRTRIIGRIENSLNRAQTPIGSSTYYTATGSSVGASESQTTPKSNITIGGASGGIAVLLNPETNFGYYFEIAALTETNVQAYSGIQNLFFYKINKSKTTENAIPVRLWSGWSSIIVDDGAFTGQGRMVSQENPTVYDLSVEYKDEAGARKFFLYINNKLVGTVVDREPLPIYNSMALFIRGSSRLMFENVYAITNNYSQNSGYSINTPVEEAFTDNEISVNEAFQKYAMSGIIQKTYLSSISAQDPPMFNLYFEEFGTIMREVGYFNIKYDKAYPALKAKMSPTFNKVQGYTVSGFVAGAYGAEFLVFNSTDKALSLDETSGNYLRIQGVTFTQQLQSELTVDSYFDQNSNYSNATYSKQDVVSKIQKSKQKYTDIKNNRATFGKKEFALDTTYIQTQEDAEDLMSWIISKIIKPRKSVGVKLFAMPTAQLGDIVEVNYKSDNVNEVSVDGARFVIYQIEYSKDQTGPSMTVFLSEVD